MSHLAGNGRFRREQLGSIVGASPDVELPLLPFGLVDQVLGGRYRIKRKLGQGGMATVYLADDETESKQVAIKVLRPELAAALGPERFLREITIAGSIEHPNIVPLLGHGDENGLLYYVMPFIPNGTLRDRLQAEGPLPIDDAVAITMDLTAALERAHSAGIVHRDIKPENILLAKGGSVLADFGVARLVIASGIGATTNSSAGLMVGTAGYMSPEQAMAHPRIDGRADIYSLGCVLFEMLTGTPPFLGANAQAVTARHLYEAPPRLRVVRPGVPAWLQPVVDRCLAKNAADRYASASELATALAVRAPATSTNQGRTSAVIFVAAVIVIAGFVWLRVRQPAVTSNRFLVAPCVVREETSALELKADNCTRLMSQALREWQDLELVDDAVVADLIKRGKEGRAPQTLSGARSLARAAGADRLVRAEIWQSPDSLFIDAAVFSSQEGVRGSARRLQVGVAVGRLRDDAAASQELIRAFRRLVNALVVPAASGSAGPDTLPGTVLYRALLASLAGDSALSQWNLDLARTRYREAFTIDQNYAGPKLKYAKAATWADEPPAVWSRLVREALAGANQLGPNDRVEAEALLAYGEGRFTEACDRYRAMAGRDSSSFSAWFGLGECQARDSVVIRDRASPSGWRFRGSIAAGAAAYLRAFGSVPLAHQAFGGLALSRLAPRLMAEPNQFRMGVALSPNAARFAAYPGFEGDSLSFVPFPIEAVLSGERVPATRGVAVAQARKTLLDITTIWAARYPESDRALEAHAVALELAGIISSPTPDETSALGVVRKLRGRPPFVADVALAGREVRLLVKSRQFTDARRLAIEALSMKPKSRADGVLQAGLAALIGDPHRAAALLAEFDTDPFTTMEGSVLVAPAVVTQEAKRLLAYAAVGGPADSVVAIAARVARKVAEHVDAGRQRVVLDAVMFRPSLLAFPLLRAPTGADLPSISIERYLESRDTVAALRLAVTLSVQRATQLPGDVTPEQIVLEARLLDLAGDRPRAVRQLERMLADLVPLGSDFLDGVASAAAVGRAAKLLLDYRTGPPAGPSHPIGLWFPIDSTRAQQPR